MTDGPTVDPVAGIHLVAYDDTWPERFRQEREVLSGAIGEYVKGSIEHVGSTAVAGLVAKPVIDVMVGVEGLAASRGAFPILERLSYCYFPHHADVMHWFCKPSPQHRTHHLHLVPFRSRLWRERMAFRDYLRGHPEVAAEYGKLKQALARRYRFDREAYTDAKKPFVRRIVERALSREAPAGGG